MALEAKGWLRSALGGRGGARDRALAALLADPPAMDLSALEARRRRARRRALWRRRRGGASPLAGRGVISWRLDRRLGGDALRGDDDSDMHARGQSATSIAMVYAYLQLSRKLGVQLGAEFVEAAEWAASHDVRVSLGPPTHVTLARGMAALSPWEKVNPLSPDRCGVLLRGDRGSRDLESMRAAGRSGVDDEAQCFQEYCTRLEAPLVDANTSSPSSAVLAGGAALQPGRALFEPGPVLDKLAPSGRGAAVCGGVPAVGITLDHVTEAVRGGGHASRAGVGDNRHPRRRGC